MLVGALFSVHSIGTVHSDSVRTSRNCALDFHHLTGHDPWTPEIA
jgi:hypothetical protein